MAGETPVGTPGIRQRGSEGTSEGAPSQAESGAATPGLWWLLGYAAVLGVFPIRSQNASNAFRLSSADPASRIACTSFSRAM